MIILALGSCKKDTNEIELIRPRIKLSSSDIPVLMKMGKIKNNSIRINQAYKSTMYDYQWSTSDSNRCFVHIYVYENSTDAYNFFISDKNAFSSDRNSYDKKIDSPAFVGFCSYNKGHQFVRNNLYVKIGVNSEIDELVPEIAKSVDKKILESETFFDIEHLKICFADFYFEENPAPKNKKIALKYSYQLAQEGVYADISFFRLENYVVEGVSFDNLNVFYDSTIADPNVTTVGFNMCVISNYGFCSDSTIYIQFE